MGSLQRQVYLKLSVLECLQIHLTFLLFLAFFFFICKIKKIFNFILGERVSRERMRERILSRLCAASTKPA